MKASEIRILVIDDEPLTMKAVATNFEVFGFQVEKCESIEKAREAIKNIDFQIVLLDWHMPQGGGEKLLKELRAKDWAHPAIFLMTGDLSLNAQEVFQMGADGFLLKPFDSAASRDLIQQSCLSRKQMWMTPYRIEPSASVEETIENLDSKQSAVTFGRGGFFVAQPNHGIQDEDVLSFTINVSSDKLCRKISGVGLVRWVRAQDDGELKAGYGVEVKFLDDMGRDLLLDWMEELMPIPFIPSNNI